MSHFSVMVIGPNPEQQLAPYHEFECTGIDDEYVQDIDITEKTRAEFESRTTNRLRAADGSLHSFFDERGNWRTEFSQPDYGPFDRTRRKKLVPAGYQEIEVPTKDVQTFAEFITGWSGQTSVPFGSKPDLADQHKYGYVLLDSNGQVTQVIDRANPNKKWDWYVLGGRYKERLLLRDGSRADQALKRDISLDAMRDEKETEARACYRRFIAALGDHEFPRSWERTRTNHANDITKAREIYNAQPAIVAMQAHDEFKNYFDVDLAVEFDCTEDKYAARARLRATGAFAVLKDGRWHERGSMGWFASVSDEKEEDVWYAQAAALLDDAAHDTLISIFDCHI